jgi:hypothetical protein
MLIEVGDFSELGEAWVRYQGNQVVNDYSELLRHGRRLDPNGTLTAEREPQLVQYYALEPSELDGCYPVGGCWVFRVASPAS